MTALTLFHTVVSILPVGLGLAAFARDGRIDPKARLGQLYLGTMLIGSVSSFGFIATLGFTPGQVFTLITLALLFAGVFTLRGRWREPGYVQIITLSTTYLLLMVFATTETLKRVPVGHPFAAGPTDPSLVPVRLGLLVAYALGVGYQILKLRAATGPVARASADFSRRTIRRRNGSLNHRVVVSAAWCFSALTFGSLESEK